LRSQPDLALPRHLLPEQRQPDPPGTFPVRLAACRQAAVERERPVALEHLALVALERRAALVQLRTAVHSVAAAVVQAAAAAEQTRSMR
jgi:hypothetical protein